MNLILNICVQYLLEITQANAPTANDDAPGAFACADICIAEICN